MFVFLMYEYLNYPPMASFGLSLASPSAPASATAPPPQPPLVRLLVLTAQAWLFCLPSSALNVYVTCFAYGPIPAFASSSSACGVPPPAASLVYMLWGSVCLVCVCVGRGFDSFFPSLTLSSNVFFSSCVFFPSFFFSLFLSLL